jgi:hypothetical protein
MNNKQTATITVYEPCECCTNLRWFQCPRIGFRFIARYDCDGLEDCPSSPTKAHIKWVEQQHPGKVLVYLD